MISVKFFNTRFNFFSGVFYSLFLGQYKRTRQEGHNKVFVNLVLVGRFMNDYDIK